MNRLMIVLCAVFIIYLSSCASKKIIKPHGDMGSFTINNVSFKGELLTVNKKVVLFLHNKNIYIIPLEMIQNIYVEGYSRKKAKLFQTSVFAGLAIAEIYVGTLEAPGWYYFGIPSLILLSYSYFSGDPDMDFSSDDENFITKILPYCRFPQGLNQNQIDMLLKYYNQDGLKTF